MDVEQEAIGQRNVQVAIRVRQLNPKEVNQGDSSVIQVQGNKLIMGNGRDSRTFTFDNVFGEDSKQKEVFQKCAQNLVLRCFQGYNSTLLAYGQTGSGKTYTMGTQVQMGINPEVSGIVPRVIKFIFEQIASRSDVQLRVSYLEIYNENLIDLLDLSKSQLSVAQDKDGTITIPGLTEDNASTPQLMLQALDRGGLNRTTGSTNMNERSSRSHAIFTVHFQIESAQEEGCEVGYVTAKFHFVDLAGSERLKKTHAVGKQMEEGIYINQSLLVLGNVIKLLSDNAKSSNRGQVHIPYRNSKLTRLLQDSLGGNANTYMIACVSPADSNFDETLNALKYASRAREIENTPTINRDPQNAVLQAFRDNIKDLSAEVGRLKAILQQNGVEFIARPMTAPQPTITTSDESMETIKRLRSNCLLYEKQVIHLQAEVKTTKKQLNDTDIQLYAIRRERDLIQHRSQAYLALLKENNIPAPVNAPEDTNIIDAYSKEISQLKIQLNYKQQSYEELQLQFDQMQRDSQRDSKMLMEKMEMIDFLKRQLKKRVQKVKGVQKVDSQSDEEIELVEDEEVEIEIEKEFEQFEDRQRKCQTEIDDVNYQIEQEEEKLAHMSRLNEKNKEILANEMKRDYDQQIHLLEFEQQTMMQKLCNLSQAEKNSDQLRVKVQSLEGKINEMRVKENHQKALHRRTEDQDKQLQELKGFIERMKKQKHDLSRKLKEESDKFVKFKDDRNRDIMVVRKKMATQDAQLRKVLMQKQRIELVLKRKDDENLKLKAHQRIANKKQTHVKPKHNGGSQGGDWENEESLRSIFRDVVSSSAAYSRIERDTSKVLETMNEKTHVGQKKFQLEIRRDQLTYDLNTSSSSQNLEPLNQELSQLEMELLDVEQVIENMDEVIEYQKSQLDEQRRVAKEAGGRYIAFIDDLQIPAPAARAIKFLFEHWADQFITNQDLNQKFQVLQAQLDASNQQDKYQKLDDEVCPESPNRPLKQKVIAEEEEGLRRQLDNQRKKNEKLNTELTKVKHNENYLKNMLLSYQNKFVKDKSIGLDAQEQAQGSNTNLQLNSIQAMRDNKKKEKMDKLKLIVRNDSIQPNKVSGQKQSKLERSAKLLKKSNQDIDPDLASDTDGPNTSYDFFQDDQQYDLKWELVKSFQAHDFQILSCTSCDNVLYSTAFKQFRIWDLEKQTLITSIEHQGYVKSACYWEERKAIAVANGNQISLYDINSLMFMGALKTVDEVKVLVQCGKYLVSGGKGNSNQGAIQVWDGASNKYCAIDNIQSAVLDMEKGQDIFSLIVQGGSIYWGTRTHYVRTTNILTQSPITQLEPPLYDRVTGLGILGNWVIGCSAGKDMRMWHQRNYNIAKSNADIHKDVINTMTIDPKLKLIYTGSKNGQLKAIRINNEKFQQISDINASTQSINAITLIQNSNCVVTGGQDKLLKIWKPSQYTMELLRYNQENVSEFQIEEEPNTN